MRVLRIFVVAVPKGIFVAPLLLSLSTSDTAVECVVEDKEYTYTNPNNMVLGNHESISDDADEDSTVRVNAEEESNEDGNHVDSYYNEESSEDDNHEDSEDEHHDNDNRGSRKLPTAEEIYNSRGCWNLSTAGRPLYTEEDWERFRQVYKDTGGGTIDVETEVPDDFVPPMRSGETTDGKGRGVFATRDIQRGERTYGGKKNFAFFRDGPSYRTFLDLLSDTEACDVMMWAWTQTSKGGMIDEPLVLLPLDDNSFTNTGGDEANVGCPPEYEDSCGMFDEFALRDIEEGEEFLCSYSDFVERDIWERFGLS